MKILLLTADFDGPGVGYDVKFSKSILDKKFTTYIFHFGKRNEPENNIYSFNKKNIIGTFKLFKKIYINQKIDLAHIRGVMSSDHIIWLFFLIIIKAKYVISPNSQLTNYNLNNKLFFENPDFKNSKDIKKIKRKKINLKDFFLKIYFIFIPFMKRVYLYTLGILFIKKSKGIILFSKYEQETIKKYKIINKIIYEPNFIENLKPLDETKIKENTLFDKKFINIVYWGRLDYRLKGIDRLLMFAKNIQEIDKENLVKLHLMGPDYNFNQKKIVSEIEKLNLKNKVLIHPDKIWKGTKEPLIKADYSILLGRWDGFPRALRESINYCVPIIVTEETNFADIVQETGCGVILNQNKENQINFISQLIENRGTTIKSHKNGCIIAKNKISIENYITELSNFYKIIVNS